MLVADQLVGRHSNSLTDCKSIISNFCFLVSSSCLGTGCTMNSTSLRSHLFLHSSEHRYPPNLHHSMEAPQVHHTVSPVHKPPLKVSHSGQGIEGVLQMKA